MRSVVDPEKLHFPLEQQVLAGSARFFFIGTTFRAKSLKYRSFFTIGKRHICFRDPECLSALEKQFIEEQGFCSFNFSGS